jgi:regulator of chromosome condensation
VPALSPKSLGGRRVVQIAGGEHHSLFLLSDGSVWGCGRTDGYELGLPKDHPAMKDILEERKANGNIDKPLSDERIDEPVPLVFPPPPTENDPAPPIPPFKSLPDPYTKPPLEPIASLSAGTRHNLAVSVSGNVYAWGSGNTYQLGLGPDVESAPVPTRVRSKQMNDYKIEAAAAGGQHCLLVATRRV